MTLSIGVIYALGLSVIKSGKSVTTKLAAEEHGALTTSFSERFLAAAMLTGIGLLAGIRTIPTNWEFWGSFVVVSVIYGSTGVLLTYAFKISDASIVSPLSAFIPIGTIIPAWVILGEKISALAGIGLALVSVGAYTLQIDKADSGILRPFKSLVQDRGAQVVGAVVCISSIGPTFEKIALRHAEPLTWAPILLFGTTTFMGLILISQRNQIDTELHSKSVRPLVLLGAFSGLLMLTQSYAYQHLNAAYVQSLKRLSVLFVVLSGHVIFDEENISQRFVGGAIIIAGVSLIIIYG